MENGNTLSPGQQANWHAAIITALPWDVPADVVEGWTRNREALRTALRGALCPLALASGPKVWKTVELGRHKSVAGLKRALKAADCRFGYGNAEQIMDASTFVLANKRREVDLIIQSPRDLGLIDDFGYQRICDKAQEKGFELCDAEVGPALRLIHRERLKGGWKRIGMRPFFLQGDLKIFTMGWDKFGRWLAAMDARPNAQYNADDSFVFVLPRK